ncbi:hypothetical protein Bsp3421_000155 (plasmid) [Burkholderia sp. FERM BP-3421]|uniref:hypothetical protein n=1 Tax=Burkholderia sp. FERM BP-3421 TaxID=1494466 RepID=UPI002362DE29|nr:hypothetical protein [Burkholderia sp. FERM BP-3421]WDD90330.1 hypothetical protein Bsp3421_000155 [Burkholderia sp. FERM BP-3421]
MTDNEGMKPTEQQSPYVGVFVDERSTVGRVPWDQVSEVRGAEEMNMVALTDLILAETAQEYDELQRQFRSEQAAKPSDAEVLTTFMRDCTDAAGAPLLQADKYAVFNGGRIIRKNLD